MRHSRKVITLCLLMVISTFTMGQVQKFTISGQIKDAVNGEDLPLANVIIKDLPATGTNTNVYGFFSITLEEGEHILSFQYVGYESVEKRIQLDQDLQLVIELHEESTEIDEVVIAAELDNDNITSNEGSVTKVDMKEVRKIATFGGEPDLTKVITMTPGIKASGEGSGGFYVRGGGLDQNLILLDEAPVYNPSHLLGFFSVFNGDAIKDATVYKGGMPAEYGGRTSSVMDIRMKDGNNKKFGLSGGVGLLSARLTAEGPLVKDKGSFMVSGRRTYADLFLKLSSDPTFNSSQLYFYDLNMKANYRFNEKNRLFVSGYFGRDNFGFEDQFGLDWGNATGTVRWNHLFSDKVFSNTTVIFSDYDYEFGFGVGDDQLAMQSVVRDWNVKQDFTWYLNDKNTLKIGANAIYHNIEPGNLSAGSNLGIQSREAEQKYGIEGAVYVQNEQKVGARLKLNYGLRYSLFDQIGPGSVKEFDEEGNLVSTETVDNSQSIQFYHGLEPRLSANYMLDDQTSLKLGYNRNFQYIHMLSNATASTPTDVWIMSSNNVKPQIADQVSLGFFRNFNNNMYEASAEVYYKDMQNVLDYRTGADVFFNEDLEGDLLSGDGKAYGLELFVKKNKGRLTGWISYTLSRTLREIDGINNGEAFPARQDRINDLSVVLMYALTKKVSLSTNFVYYTGDAVTYPTGRYIVDGNIVPIYTDRNAGRMPDYHRLDLGVTWERKKTEKFESSWNFSLYNAYGQENAFSINFQPNETDPTQTEAVRLALFKWVPSITYNFKF